ncbi:Hypothetical predicted protein [Octopus vulgaris]|uniref:Uncharacterized protein n=1 Tax=Octopus vulgaris TaxID=6645 RepID=A0AA36AKK8_OCTVU|nr:Hypothetical predicted protein [Octopus vulgaris]
MRPPLWLNLKSSALIVYFKFSLCVRPFLLSICNQHVFGFGISYSELTDLANDIDAADNFRYGSSMYLN